MIDLRYVKKLVELLDGSSVDSIEISTDKGMKIRISKTPQQRGSLQVAAPVQMPAMMPAMMPQAVPLSRMTPTEGMLTISNGEPAARAEPPKSKLLEIKSPMVGTYYSMPEPGAKQYITVGDKIAKGQIVCIIEAMKIMNEIESDFAGTVKEILVDDAHPVEYGQALFRIDPNG